MLDFLAQHADAIFTAGSVLFIIALIPMLRAVEKPPILASVQTAAVLTAFAATYVALGLTFSAVTTSITALCWWTLAVQRLRRRAEPEPEPLTWQEWHRGVDMTPAERATIERRGGW